MLREPLLHDENEPGKAIAHPRGSLSCSSAILLAANAFPLIGVFFFDWKIFDVVVLYWFENVIVGLLNILRMACLPNGESPVATILQKLFTIAFFTVHYGIFTLVHGVFVFSLLGPGNGSPGFFGKAHPEALHDLRWAIPALFASHLVSFFVNFIGKKEYQGVSVQQQMFAPYGRVVALHLAVLFGAFGIQVLGEPVILLAILIVGKTVVDWRLHLRSHRRAT